MPMSSQEIVSLTKGLSLAALGVGSLLVIKKKYDNRIIVNFIDDATSQIKRWYDNYFRINRLIDSDCSGKEVSIGVNPQKNPDNTSLILAKNDKTNKILYSFETPKNTVVKEMDDRIWPMYKTIGLSSNELDKIAELK